ncbi:hypothetical protein EGW08_009870 [Elysia chlorotica]|uniref:Dermatopontin n=1 Tax=Elysia chlorotica TaxID=188477 RepID=A0A3S1BJJ6_ELYCH|nr:hypothetical protein EGW08_009870 [Elysia chlorotica]
MSLVFPALVAALCLTLHTSDVHASYANRWDKEFRFECPEGEVLRNVLSVHSNLMEDRRFMFSCGAAPFGGRPSTCKWTHDYVNDFDEPINFMCEPDAVLTGVDSINSNDHQDRRMKFKCCKATGYKTASCGLTPYLNAWDSMMTYNVPPGKVLTGWFSVHSDGAQDRRHKMLFCNYNTQ